MSKKKKQFQKLGKPQGQSARPDVRSQRPSGPPRWAPFALWLFRLPRPQIPTGVWVALGAFSVLVFAPPDWQVPLLVSGLGVGLALGAIQRYRNTRRAMREPAMWDPRANVLDELDD